MADPNVVGLCGHLRRIATLLEKGEPEVAAAAVAEMNEFLRGAPTEMPDAEYAEAQRLLTHCEDLEQSARQDVLRSLQQIAATRRSSIYFRFVRDP